VQCVTGGQGKIHIWLLSVGQRKYSTWYEDVFISLFKTTVGSFFSIIFSNFSHYSLMYNYYWYSGKVSYLLKLLAGRLIVNLFLIWNLAAVRGSHRAATQHLLDSKISLYKYYVSLLGYFLSNTQNICESCLVISHITRNYQPLFPEASFAILLPKLLYIRLHTSNHLGPSRTTK
jgi:hypothetical protein